MRIDLVRGLVDRGTIRIEGLQHLALLASRIRRDTFQRLFGDEKGDLERVVIAPELDRAARGQEAPARIRKIQGHGDAFSPNRQTRPGEALRGIARGSSIAKHTMAASGLCTNTKPTQKK